MLRRSRLVTAQKLAEELEVSERTVYRDVRDLALSGVPIRGEAGMGYALAQGFDLPPLMFTEEEIEALVLGARVVQGFADPALARAADSVLAKCEMVLPDRLRGRVAGTALLAPNVHGTGKAPNLGALRGAMRERRKVKFRYVDLKEQSSSRVVWPLAVAFWGKTWTLAAWCEMREDFRGFRLDRMSELTVMPERYPIAKGRTLEDFLEKVSKEPPRHRARE